MLELKNLYFQVDDDGTDKEIIRDISLSVPDGVLTIDQMGRKIITNADTIVSAIGRVPLDNKGFLKALREEGFYTVPIGDALGARKVTNAIHEAFHAAMSI